MVVLLGKGNHGAQLAVFSPSHLLEALRCRSLRYGSEKEQHHELDQVIGQISSLTSASTRHGVN